MSTMATDDARNSEVEYEDDNRSGSEVEYEEEEVEEEVEEVEEEDAPEPSTPKPSTPKLTPSKQAGKVRPTSEVKKAPMESPASMESKSTSASLSPAKNPFTTMGMWTPNTFKEITLDFPILNNKCESTNDLTRNTRPEARYWKGPVKFSYASYTSDTVRIANVHIPYHTGRGYGENFVYVCLPGFMADKFAVEGKTRRPTVTNEPSLMPDSNRWWKIANNITDKVGVLSKEDGLFRAKSLSTIFEGTNKGVTVNLIARFLAKASTDEREQLKPTTPQKVTLEIERAFIEATDVDVEMPRRIPRNTTKAEPTALRADIASDSLMKRLAQLGL